MRRIRHPIALFIIAVIGVIGIGVGVLAASGGAGFVMAPNLTKAPRATYGPPGLQFVAAFPGTPTCRAAENGATFGCHVGHTAHELFAISVTNTSRLSQGHPGLRPCWVEHGGNQLHRQTFGDDGPRIATVVWQ